MIDNTGLPDEGHEQERQAFDFEQELLTLINSEPSAPDKPKFTPTEDQSKALELMTNWYLDKDRPDPFFCLRGYAGTGKTFSITELVNRGVVKANKVCFTAPTNKAVKVLRGSLNDAGVTSPTRTIYSLLGLQMTANGEVKELTSPDPEAIDLSDLDLVVVDEGSMINRFLMKEIERVAARFDLPFLFMGDPAQLPPVGEDRSPIWSITNGFELTKVMRYDNAILDLATALRKVVDHPAPSVTIPKVEPVFVHDRSSFDRTILDHLEQLKDGSAKVIAWRNVRVNEYNSMIRAAIYGLAEAKSNPFLEGDKIVATEPGKDLEGNPLFKTDEEFTILRVAISKHPMYREYECFRILAKHEDGRQIVLHALTPVGDFDLNNKLNQLSTDAKAGKRFLWREFWNLKEAFHKIRPSYAITSHRSQGSSYQVAFVDRMDILLNKNRSEAFRSLYVACTRARKELHIC